MPRDSITHMPKQKRQAKHIMDSYAKRGVPARRREEIAWATVNKIAASGGGRRRAAGSLGRTSGTRRVGRRMSKSKSTTSH